MNPMANSGDNAECRLQRKMRLVRSRQESSVTSARSLRSEVQMSYYRDTLARLATPATA
jgi:hypothetical protein